MEMGAGVTTEIVWSNTGIGTGGASAPGACGRGSVGGSSPLEFHGALDPILGCPCRRGSGFSGARVRPRGHGPNVEMCNACRDRGGRRGGRCWKWLGYSGSPRPRLRRRVVVAHYYLLDWGGCGGVMCVVIGVCCWDRRRCS